MPYFEQKPTGTLQACIHAYGELRLAERRDQTVEERTLPLPGKCLVFQLNTEQSIYVKEGGRRQRLPSIYITGLGCPEVTWTHSGDFAIFFVLFRPGGMEKFMELREGGLLNESSQKKLKDLGIRLLGSELFRNRVALVDKFFRDIYRDSNESPEAVYKAMELIEQDPTITLERLSKRLFVGKRHLRRTFRGTLGLTIKEYQQIVRISRCMHQLVERRYKKIGDIAHDWGFYDQTHFNQAFKKYTGLTPRSFLIGDYPLMSALFWKKNISDNSGKEEELDTA